jgi:hypothetical protein
MNVYLRCIEEDCQHRLSANSKSYVCPKCGGLLDVLYDFSLPLSAEDSPMILWTSVESGDTAS